MPRLEPPPSEPFTQPRRLQGHLPRITAPLFNFAFSAAIRAMTSATTVSISMAVSRYLPPTIMPANRTRIFSPSFLGA